MNAFNYVVVILLAFHATSYAQLGDGTFLRQIDAESVSTGGCLIDFSKSSSVTIALHVQRPYSLKALDRVGAVISMPLKSLEVCAAFQQSGDALLMERTLQSSCIKSLSKTTRVTIGCGLYIIRAINGYSGKGAFADLGVQYSINETLTAGCRLINPTGTPVKMEGEKKRLEQSCIIGLMYCPSTQIDLHLEGEKCPRQKPITHVGLTYRLDHALMVMGGFSTFPLQPTWGVGGKTGSVSYTLGFRMHPQLGLTSAFTCSYRFRRKP